MDLVNLGPNAMQNHSTVNASAGNRGERTCIVIVLLTCTCFICFMYSVGGCATSKTFKLFRPSPQKSLLVALKGTDPDARYQALARLATSKALTEDWSVRALVIISQTDPSPLVRALAIRSLGRVGDERVTKPILASMNDPDPRVRAQAAWALAQVPYSIFDNNKIVDEASAVLLKALIRDTDLDVRIHSASALGNFKDAGDSEILLGLISALKDRDFAVRYHAEQSLTALTGKTFQANAAQWLDWFKQAENKNKNPFELAGATPPELVRPKRSFWKETWVYQWYLNWQGPAKQ